MLSAEEISEIILEKTLEISASFGEEAGLLFLQGVNFGADLAIRALDITKDDSTSENLYNYYTNITKGEIN
jgi:hypothetical protein